jgi:hypothetical protein
MLKQKTDIPNAALPKQISRRALRVWGFCLGAALGTALSSVWHVRGTSLLVPAPYQHHHNLKDHPSRGNRDNRGPSNLTQTLIAIPGMTDERQSPLRLGETGYHDRIKTVSFASHITAFDSPTGRPA